MHDLLKCNGGKYERILAGTVDEKSAIDELVFKMLEEDEDRFTKTKSIKERWFKSEYSPIRHGAQTSYISYLLTTEGNKDLGKIDLSTNKLPLEGQVTTISNKIIMYDEKGDAYLLKNLDEIYSYYCKHKLLDQIPFYFFFSDLEVTEYSKYFNKLFSRHKSI